MRESSVTRPSSRGTLEIHPREHGLAAPTSRSRTVRLPRAVAASGRRGPRRTRCAKSATRLSSPTRCRTRPDLHELLVDHHRQRRIEHRRVRRRDDVRGHDRILAVLEDPVERTAVRLLGESRVDLLLPMSARSRRRGPRPTRDHRRTHGNAVRACRRAPGAPGPRPSRALVGGHQVDRRRPPRRRSCAALLEVLVGRVRMDRGHDPALDPHRVVEHLATGARQLVVHEALEITWCSGS